MIANACLDANAAHEMEHDLRGFLTRHGLAADDIDAFVNSKPRLALYRRLVRQNWIDVASKMMPRTRARMNARVANAFDDWFATFLEEAAPRTHFLRDVPAEFLAWALPRWRDDRSVPSYAIDLARHEHVEFQICAAPASHAPANLADVALDRRLVFTPIVRVMTYAFAVHKLAADIDDRIEPDAGAVSMLVYRDADHVARFLELTPLAADITTRLMDGDTLAAALPVACAAHHVDMTDAILADIARLLADLGDRGVLLGALEN
jgi:hypothetical protein